MDIENFISEFKKTFVYNMLKDYVSDEKLFDHVVEGAEVIWMKEQTRQMWSMWQAAQAVPDGYVLAPKEPTEKMIRAGRDERRDLGTVASTYKAMIEAVQESTDD